MLQPRSVAASTEASAGAVSHTRVGAVSWHQPGSAFSDRNRKPGGNLVNVSFPARVYRCPQRLRSKPLQLAFRMDYDSFLRIISALRRGRIGAERSDPA